MFATQNYVDVMSDPGRKRYRDGEDDPSSMGFGEHRNKRIQCLPLRTSPRSAEQWQPLPSFNSDADGHNHQQGVEMDMMDSSFNTDGCLHPSEQAGLNMTGRMPTPIQPSFAAQVRGQQCEWAGPGPTLSNLSGVVNLGHHPSGFSEDQYVPRAMSNVADWQAVQNNRRLPSPISEDGPALGPGLGSLNMMLDDNNMSMMSDDSLLTTPQRTMDHPNAMMDIESPTQEQEIDPDAESSSPSPARRGHIRSKHTINSWTWQPGMKRSFSIGYRADCEKCRLKVPGHFNHIIIS
ncbi:hypothetical protein PT974_03714 [Cladobotryum mycophilum]|uniref:Uncharacterized protein n=1 Tax=Cladobotryum mycophilum TaxID=491253 RepID=A0ABR0STR1_9HYPO